MDSKESLEAARREALAQKAMDPWSGVD